MIPKLIIIRRKEAFSRYCNKLLKIIASRAEEIAPIRIRLALLRSIPNKMKEPSPPAPIKEAKVAVPIIMTADVRTPDIITGIAIGISNVFNRSHLVIPKAIPASTRLGSIPFNPVMVFCKIGKIA